MATTLKPVDAVMVGFGWTGAIMSQQLCDAGLNVLGLERGPWRDTSTEFATGFAQDELRYMWRHHLFQNVSDDTLTIRNHVNQEALPMRHLGSFLLGTGVGSGGVHWNGQIWRFLPSDFETKSHNQERYGKSAVTDYDLTVQDWGVTYDELELHYDAFDKLCGTSGKAGNLRGQIQPGGNPFEGSRSDEYPTPPMKQTYGPTLFGQAAASLGRHPFPHPGGNLSQSYVNPLGCQLGKCTYCGFCEKFGCGNYSKASPQTTVLPYLMRKSNFELRTECEVLRIELTPDKRRATGVTYVNSAGEEFFQPAEMVFLGAYILHNVRLLLLSGIGQPYDPKTGDGLVGKNYAYQTMSSVNVFFDDKIINPFIGAGALATVVDDFNGDNFDHSGLGFIGGAYIAGMVTGGRPIEMMYTPKGTPAWGLEWKHSAAKNYLRSFNLSIHGSSMSSRGNYLDLDPTYRDVFGRPMLRMTFDFNENDLKMSNYLTDRAAEIARAMNPREIKENRRKGAWSVVPYQTTHNTGGAIMGDNPQNSVINKYLQSWDVPNVFSMGAGAFPQNPGYNPTATVAALTYHAAQAIIERYLKTPGPLVHA
ncbi:GMC family oxidoreductase [Bradyrhizobium sp. CCGB20]|uniref:GMC family oxidoreductase n=1 Tax=Bradyrhizobium sp. CCGB20 TaxID=2949633 RepID=UPI0020B19782|nr:GMC family oxidoreductase [Bradyrhizobium sp. CCGB20]MCP3402771.1 GMC family oxidoreductase [Bradyrhizobium sp. CCGB20]